MSCVRSTANSRSDRSPAMANKAQKHNKPETTAHDLQCLCISDLHKLALERMDKQTRDYYNEGADDNLTLNENNTGYQKYRLRPRVLRDVSEIDTSVNVFGSYKNGVPFGVAPTAMQGLAHIDGELGTARACREAGIAMGLSSFSTTSLEDVREASGNNVNVLQLYLFEDKSKSERLIQRAKKAGYKAVLLTVDTPMLGRRNADMRNQFTLPGHLKVMNFVDDDPSNHTSAASKKEAQESESKDIDVEQDWESPNVGRKRTPSQEENESPKDIDVEQDWESPNVGRKRTPSQEENNQSPEDDKAKSMPGYHDGTQRIPPSGPITFHTHAPNPTLVWDSAIPWLKRVAHPMQVWVKGVLTSEDADLAVQHNVDGIIVSNHGGRQLNGAMATIDALPEIVKAVAGRVPVHVDGGLRHGTDIFKALALGADFCWVGRPVLWGLAYKGEEGVRTCLRLLSDEFKLCMGLTGTVRVKDINSQYLVKMDRSGFVSKL